MALKEMSAVTRVACRRGPRLSTPPVTRRGPLTADAVARIRARFEADGVTAR